MLPVLFTLPMPWGPQPIYAYGLLLGLSLIVGFQIVSRLGRRAGLAQDVLGTAYFVAAICGLVGARALYVVSNLDGLAESGQNWFDVTAGGLSAYGGLLGGSAGAAAYLRWKHVRLLDVFDTAAPAVAFGTALTRVGCYLHGCDYGTRLPEGAPAWLAGLGTFPRWQLESLGIDGSPAFWHHVDRYGLSPEATASFPVHPTQLYELVFALAATGLTLWLLPRKRFAGQVVLVYAIVYAAFRFFIEYLRDDTERGELLGFSSPQLISLVLLPACVTLYTLLRRPRSSSLSSRS